MKDIRQALQERKIFNNALQKKYDSLKEYSDKLEFIFNILKISQNDYLEYTYQETLSDSYLELLKVELKKYQNMNDTLFIDFIVENLFDKKYSEHVFLKSNDLLEKKEIKLSTSTSKNVIFSLKNDILNIIIPSFSRQYLESDKLVFKNLENQLHINNIKSVIIDLRGNSGGTDEYFELLSCLFNKDVVIQESFKNLFSKETETYDNVLITHGTNIDYKKFVLVDKKVFSTAERLSEGLQKTKSAIVLGERTLGEGYGFTPLQLDLVNNYCGKYRKNRKARNVSLQFTLEAPINKLGKIDYKSNYCMIPDIECEPASALSIAEELAMDMQVKNKEKLNLLKTKLELLNQKQIVDNYNAYQQESNKLTLNRKKSGFIDAIYLLLILGLIIIMGIVIANLMV